MKKLLPLLLLLQVSLLQAQTYGLLDDDFANHGFSTMDWGNFESILDMDIQPDGKVVAVGYTEEKDASRMIILRYMPDGSLDTTFADKGIQEATFLPGVNIAQTVAIQSDGKIVVAGYASNSTAANTNNEELVVLRLNANGMPDMTFGNNSVQLLNLGANERPVSIQITPNGRILVAGNAFQNETSTIFVTRFAENGTIDNFFGNNGLALVAVANGAWNYCFDMALQSDNKIVLAGEMKLLNGTNFAVIRLNANGTYDQTFSNDGKTSINLTINDDDGAQALLIMPDGKIMLGGYRLNASGKSETALIRIHADGSVDDTFGDEGKIIVQMGTDYSAVTDLAWSNTGSVIVAGTAKKVTSHFDFFLAAYTSDGTLDENFGTGGITYTDYDSHYDGISDIEILANDQILVAGTAVNTQNSISDFTIARYSQGEQVATQDIFPQGSALTAFPNPVSDAVLSLHYTVPESSHVVIDLFSVDGKWICTLLNNWQISGEQNTTVKLPAGLPKDSYMVRVNTGKLSVSTKIVVQ